MFHLPEPSVPSAELLPAIVSFPAINSVSAEARASVGSEKIAPCDLTAAFMVQFEKISGWEIQFSESPKSRKGSDDCDHNGGLEGNFSIIDMSADWPAQKPTLHRGECDKLVAIFSELVASQNAIAAELHNARATLDSLTNNNDGDEDLIDSFLPLGPLTTSQGDSADDEWVLDQHGVASDSDFVVQQTVDSDWLTNGGTWNNWSVAGATGIAGDRYLDWSHSSEKITVFVGRLESSLGSGDAESRLEICPDSRKFRVSDASRFSTFFAWDRRDSQLEKVEPDTWQQLPPGGAVVVATTPDVELPKKVADLDCSNVTAEQLAAAIENQMSENERLLVIKYC